MPLKTSSRSRNADRGSRKVRVDIGKSRGSGDGGTTLKSKDRTTDRAHGGKKVASVRSKSSIDERGDVPPRKVGGGIGKPKQSSDGGGTLEWKEKIIKKINSRGSGNDGVNERFKSRGSGSKGGNGGYKGVGAGDGHRKRKRICAGDTEASGKDGSYAGNREFKRNVVFKRENVRGKTDGADRPAPARVRLGFRTMQKRDRRNGLLGLFMKRTDTTESKRGTDYSNRPQRNKVLGKKSRPATESELAEDRARRKQRIIRIDPHDISQKRLDDSISNEGNSQGNKELPDTSEVEMSKNAEFRAIIPSSSILSFVDDNLLGRRRNLEFKKAGYNIEISAPLDNIPLSTSSGRERVDVPAFRNKLEFFAAAKISSSIPVPDLPEIAFAGRSNVGKSSLLNSLTRQWGVARTSDKPGLTQTINFFKLGPKMSLVDLPGYGFAYAKDVVKESWEVLVKEYVSTRVTLKRVCLLIDTKWGMKPGDHELIELMERSRTKYQIVLTKTDLVFPIDVARRAMQIEEKLKANRSAVQPLMMVSSRTGAGIRSLRTTLANIVRFAKR